VKSLWQIKLDEEKNIRTLYVKGSLVVDDASHDYEGGQLMVNSLATQEYRMDPPYNKNKEKEKYFAMGCQILRSVKKLTLCHFFFVKCFCGVNVKAMKNHSSTLQKNSNNTSWFSSVSNFLAVSLFPGFLCS